MNLLQSKTSKQQHQQQQQQILLENMALHLFFFSGLFSCYLRVPQGLSIKLNFTSFYTQQFADNLDIFEGIGQNKTLRGKVIFQLILFFH